MLSAQWRSANGKKIKSFRDLLVWQKAMALAKSVYCVVKYLPREETYGLSDQMRRAAVSIPSNIAEGQARQTKKEFLQFLWIARGSSAELETQLQLAIDLGYLDGVPEEQMKTLFQLSDEVSRMLYTLIARLTET